MTEDSLNECRASINAALLDAAAGWADYQIDFEFENRPTLNSVTQHNPCVSVELKFNGARQADLSSRPIHRHVGFLILTVKVKVGHGTAEQLRLLEFLYQQMQRRKIGDRKSVV